MPRRTLWSLLVLAVVIGSLPVSSALAARNRAPRIMRAVMVDKDGNGLADRVVLTYSEKIKHKLDTSRFPFVVQGYRIKKINAARGSLRLTIMLHENANAPKKPTSIKYTRTRRQPVVDLNRLQAQKQLLTKNIIGLAVTPPPPEEFTLTVNRGGDGLGTVTDNHTKIDCGTTCSATYAAGTSVTLTATPDAATKATFASWSGCTSETPSCTVTMDADKAVTASFSKTGSFVLTVVKAGQGTGTVTSTSDNPPTGPAQINCGANCTASYAKDTRVTLTATSDQASGSTFAGFSGGGCSGTLSTCVVTMDAAKTVTATFNKLGNFDLQVTKAGSGTGTVTSGENPAKISCGADCTESYPAATQVTLTATPDQGMTFAGFSGGGCTGTSMTCNITMDAAKTVTATFNSATQRTLTVAVTPAGGGSVTSTSPSQADGINCGSDCTANYANGTNVTLSATPASGYRFDGWSGGATCPESTCQVTMDANKTVTATFSPLAVVRNLSVTVTNGTATCAVGTTIMTTCNGGYDNGTVVTVTVFPSAGFGPLPTWGGDCASAGSTVTCQVTMNANKTVTATFASIVPSVSGGTSLP
ncbi:MAG: InlB B-repeat-containing protein [Actinomycetota bacterium]